MSKYHDAEDAIRQHRCPECDGNGTQNDADLGDISYNEWPCAVCKGTGFKDGQVMVLRTMLQRGHPAIKTVKVIDVWDSDDLLPGE